MSSKYAIIKTSGKQIMVKEGQILELDRQKDLKMEVLFYFDGNKAQIGEPVLSDVTVNATVLEEKKGPKIDISRFKSKSRYRRKRSHRQPLSIVQIESIGTGKSSKKSAKKTDKKTEDKAKNKAEKATGKVKKSEEKEKKETKKKTKKTTAKKAKSTSKKKATKAKSSTKTKKTKAESKKSGKTKKTKKKKTKKEDK